MKMSTKPGLNQGSYLAIAYQCFIALGLGVCIVWSLVTTQDRPVFLYLLLVGVLAVWLYHTVSSSTGPLQLAVVSPATVIGMTVFLGWALPGLAPFFDPSLLRFLEHLGVGFDFRYTTQALGACVAGVVLLSWGVSLGQRVSRSITLPPLLSERIMKQHRVMLLYVVTMAVRLVRVAVVGIAYGSDRSSFAGFDQMVSLAERLSVFALALAIAGKLPRRHVLLMVGIELVFAGTSGMMKPVLWLMIVCLATLWFQGINWNRVRYQVFGWLGVGSILGILVVPIAELLRPMILFNQVDTRSILGMLNAAKLAFDMSWGQGVTVGWSLFVDKLLGRQSALLHILGVLIRDTPQVHDFQGIGRVLLVPLYLVPRVFWPGKPVLSRGAWFSETYLGYPTGTSNASALTVFGEAYVFAGWVGLAIALPLVGLLLGLFYDRTVVRGNALRHPVLVCIYLALLPRTLDVELEFTSYVLTIIQSWVVFYLTGFVISGKVGSTKVGSS